MNSDVFYAMVKLVSGEEVLAKVCAFIENDEVLIVLDNPIIVQFIQLSKNSFPFVKIVPWITLTDSKTHIIRRDNVITMTEIKEDALIKIHKRYVNDASFEEPHLKPNTSQVIKIDDARKSLEELFNQKESHNNLE